MADFSEQYAWEDFEQVRRRLYLISVFNGLVTVTLLLSAYWFSAPQWPWAGASAALGIIAALYVRLQRWQSSTRIATAILVYLLWVAAEYGYWGWPAVFAPGYGLKADPPVFAMFSLVNAAFPYLCFGMQLAGLWPLVLLYWRWRQYQKQRRR